MTRPTWDEYAMTLAEAASTRSEDPHRRVGTCLMRADHSIASLGYNGAPPSVEIDWGERDQRRGYVVHAEVNALRWVRPGEVALAASTSLPCATCMLEIVSYGIRRVAFRDHLDYQVYDRTLIERIALVGGVTVVHMPRRETAT